MREIILKSIRMENFKIFHAQVVEFTQLTKIFAQNYKGKSSIVDAFHWCMFGKSSTGNSEGKQFCPRRYDKDGTPIDQVDVVVELVLLVDGKEITVKKVQKQNWVRKRGDEIKTYEGDTNEYYWNEVFTKETDHKKRVAEIIDEEVFKMITNPHAFVGKKQDEQRKFMVEKVAQITDSDVFSLDGSFSELRSKMESDGKSLDEIKAINKTALKGYKEKQESIPVRIDEVSKSIIEVDFSAQELALSALKEALMATETKLSDTSKSYEEVGKLKSEIADYKTKIVETEVTAKTLLSTQKREVASKLDGISYSILKQSNQKNAITREVELLTEKISSSEVFFNTLKKRYAEEKSKEMDESQNNCPVCNQEFPADKKAEMLEKFEADKKQKLTSINLDGQKISEELKLNKSKLAELQKDLSDLTAEVLSLTEQETAVKEELGKLPTEIDLSGNALYLGYKASITALEFALKETEESLADTNTLKANLTARKAEIQSQIEVIQGVLASKQRIDDAKDRVIELREELKLSTGKAAECERLDFLLERFEQAKMGLLSERINQKFKLVKWLLFRTQKNNGIENVCIPMVHGSPYGENTTSTTEKLMAGLDIVNTLQEIYNVTAPIFVDNAEAYNSFNVPATKAQMIQLFVSEDAEIKVINE
jgi:DNA repair exonuclease SbcCD ATPase subunit